MEILSLQGLKTDTTLERLPRARCGGGSRGRKQARLGAQLCMYSRALANRPCRARALLPASFSGSPAASSVLGPSSAPYAAVQIASSQRHDLCQLTRQHIVTMTALAPTALREERREGATYTHYPPIVPDSQ